MSGQDKTHPIGDRWGRLKNFDFCSEEEPSTTWPYMLWIQPSTGIIKVRNGADTDWVAVGGAADHGQLPGLEDDDHTQYILADGTRAFSGVVSGVTPSVTAHLATKGYVDGEIITDHGALSGLEDVADHPGYLLADGSRNLTGDLSVSDGVSIGIGPALERIEFDAAGEVRVAGAVLTINNPDDSSGITLENTGGVGLSNLIIRRGAYQYLEITTTREVAIGNPSSVDAQLHVVQPGSLGAKPVLLLDQDDQDYVLAKVIATSNATDADYTLVDASDFGTPGALLGWMQWEIEDLRGGGLGNIDVWVPFYATPT